MLPALIGPSVLNADLSSLASQCQWLLDNGADYLHLDVMDGHFVPNLTFGHPVVACLQPKLPADTFIDVHMMVADPEKWIVEMAKAGASQYTFHVEATNNVMDCIQRVKAANMKVGLGIKPTTSVESVVKYADIVDTLLVMTVEPGFGGQKFMHDMMPKVKFLRDRYTNVNIQVDGGVGPENILECAEAGANMIVSGSAVMRSSDPRRVMLLMRKTVVDAMHNQSHIIAAT